MSDLSASFGVRLDPWQEAVMQAAMGERSDGTWAAKQIGLSAPRQNGKSQLIVARALAGALLFGERKIVVSAHAQDTARETFAKFLEQIDESSALAERIDKVMNALNREFIKFRNGAVIQFKARTVSGSRGFSSDCLLLDEAQILGMPAWVSINSTMSARPNPQIWLMGTPPTPEDNGEVFTSIRDAAIAGRSKTLAWLEWAADPDDDPALPETRAKANPAWESRINHEVVQGEFETYPPERFALDRLGIWSTEHRRPLVMPSWPLCASDREPPAPQALAVAHDVDRVWISVAAASRDPLPYVGEVTSRLTGEPLHVRAATGRAHALNEVARISREQGIPIVVDAKDTTLLEDLRALENPPTIIPAAFDDYTQGCSDIYDAVEARQLEHGNQASLDEAVAAAGWSAGERRKWKPLSGEVSMLKAATLALWGAKQDVDYDVLDSIF